MPKRLQDILTGIEHEVIQGSTDCTIHDVAIDSRQVVPGAIFIAIEGHTVDGHQFINAAISAGAVAIAISKNIELPPDINIIKLAQSRGGASLVANNFFDHPSSKLNLVGVTGTNGKTSITYLLHQLFSGLGYKCGLLSTIETRIGNRSLPSRLTTPDPVSFHRRLAEMVEAGCDYVFMEVSSHALDQARVLGARFKLAIFSNITHDHLDYHGTFQEYIRVKKMLFDGLEPEDFALVNADDKHSTVMLQNCHAHQFAYALQRAADFKGRVLASETSGLQLLIDGSEVFSRLIGFFNAQNLMAVYGASMILGQEKFEVLRTISELQPPPGRFEVLENRARNIVALVDYAHTPDALQKVLEAIQEIKQGSEVVITVVGCGGNRDAAKRPKMAKIACHYSDRVILTSDNPRDEDPDQIIADMREGLDDDQLQKVLSITNRREAIKTACMLATKLSVILVAGKGHETYQEIRGKRLPFDDREVVRQFLN